MHVSLSHNIVHFANRLLRSPFDRAAQQRSFVRIMHEINTCMCAESGARRAYCAAHRRTRTTGAIVRNGCAYDARDDDDTSVIRTIERTNDENNGNSNKRASERVSEECFVCCFALWRQIGNLGY